MNEYLNQGLNALTLGGGGGQLGGANQIGFGLGAQRNVSREEYMQMIQAQYAMAKQLARPAHMNRKLLLTKG